MAFFPLIDLNIAKGFCTIHNFGPNNFEKIKNSKKNVWALYSNGEKWITKDLGEIKVGDSKTYYYNDIIENTVEICSNCHPFFTGAGQNLVDTAGRIEKFNRRYNRA